MYLQRAFVENNGPIRSLHLEFPFAESGAPKPLVLVGGNGSGKTNLLSSVGDALFEAAAAHFSDVFETTISNRRPWFRIVGGATLTSGATGGATVMQFVHNGAQYWFKEKAGTLVASDLVQRAPPGFHPALSWAEEGPVKEFSIPEHVAKEVFEEGVFVYFPSSRAEIPHWINRTGIKDIEFDISPRLSRRLTKPIYVERSLDKLQQWLLSIMVESRSEIGIIRAPDGSAQLGPQGDIMQVLPAQAVLWLANAILALILDNPNARFFWTGRHAVTKLAVIAGNSIVIPSIDALSAGQATLLNIFGTLLRYADHPRWGGAVNIQLVEGICIIDEIDAHMHVALQHKAIPELIKLFPKVQFIVSTHSPLVALGMQKTFGEDGAAIVDMPTGLKIDAEQFAEFEHALRVLQDTRAFQKNMSALANLPGKMLVLLEGETDPIYMKTASEVLKITPVCEHVDFEWVGAKDQTGQGFHTGKDALNQTLTVLRANPDFIKRQIVLLYDNDAKKKDQDIGDLYVRSMPTNSENSVIEAGIENLLPVSSITDDMFETKTKVQKNGTKTVVTALKKMELCKAVCERRNPAEFERFRSVLQALESLLPQNKRSQPGPTSVPSEG